MNFFTIASDATVTQSVVADTLSAQTGVGVNLIFAAGIAMPAALAADARIYKPAVIITIPEDAILAALRSYFEELLSSNVEVVRGQDNRVAEPSSDDWVEMTPGTRERLSTNIVIYNDPKAGGVQPGVIYPAGARNILQKTQITIAVDVHGPNSADNAQIISTMLRDADACTYFANLDPNIQPLYTSDPRQMAFIDEGSQFEDRWSVDIVFQANVVISMFQEFADTVGFALPTSVTQTFGVINTDATYKE